ncbi:Membrane-bound lytic murein transglycosylase F precursor [Microbulbifer aggregans]|uniref:Membrane-bound lytic murein transglycosylase F n=1 Tax=Microbulbifer aggregans TaxID=1769779 RepID=A0A1C9W781_9GAMM|nr:transporter substrate-binding domain-containing protein [Microbulbifer aggregans]AOS96988.1 Membrane-bound lytic murein transglycosylase F precursor [Microbulbifer aggregans]
MTQRSHTLACQILLCLLILIGGCDRERNDSPLPDDAPSHPPETQQSATPEEGINPTNTATSDKETDEKETAEQGETKSDDEAGEDSSDRSAAQDDSRVATNSGEQDEADAEEEEPGFLERFTGSAAKKDDLRPEALWAPDTTGEYPIGAYNNYIEKGDLDAIKKRGKLRILVDIANTDSLHRAATQQDIEIELAKHKAELLGLEPVVLYAENFDQLIPMLVEGKGDIIANNLVPTAERAKLIDFSNPIGTTHDTLISKKDFEQIKEGDNLKGKTLAVTKGTVFETRGREFAEQHPGIRLKVVEKNYAELALDVSLGHIDFTIIDEQIFDMVSQFRDNIKKNIVFEREDPLTIGLRKNSPQLEKALNDAIRTIKLTNPYYRHVGDLDKIKERGVLRAVTRNHPGTYFMWKGRVMGYEYELLKKFAKQLDVRLEIIVAPTHKELFTMVRDGKADIAASLLSATKARDEAGMDFGPAYMKEAVGIVGRPDDKIEVLSDLNGRTIHLLRSSSQFDIVMELLESHPELRDVKVDIELVPEELTIPQILDRVADGEYDLTIADDVTVRLEHHWRDDIVNLYDLKIEENIYAWMVREGNPQLLEAVNEFFNDPEIVKLRNTLFHKYFDEPKRTRDEIKSLSEKGEISPYDKLVKKYAEQYDFDWRLIVAQMFQESTFNPKAKSWVGARGLMQVMPDTGKQVGEHKNLFDPETSVRAGLKYLEWLHRKFEDKGISPENMMWFTLASYNAGLGHVYDAQDLAEEKGWERKVWFGNVEKAMLLLSEKKYYSKARYGYARGREPYDYVRKISQRFRTYAALLEAYERQQEVGAVTCTLLSPRLAASLVSCKELASTSAEMAASR